MLYVRDLTPFGSTFQRSHVLEDIVRYIERGEQRPNIAHYFGLQELREAQFTFLNKRHVGKIVIRVAE